MKELQLKSQRFRAEREADWRRLEGLLRRVESRSASSLTDEELLAIPVLYRSTLSSLSVARATSLDHSLIEYLESLSTRAYFFVYGARASFGQRIGRFFVETWPMAVQDLWRETLASFAITVAAALVGYLLVANDPSWYGGLMSDSQGRDFTASTSDLRNVLYDSGGKDSLAVFAAYLFQHNAQIAIFAFALGFAFCIPTVLLLAQNGLSLGALFALYASRGLGFELGGWIFIHGVTELFAIILGGAAGFRIGWRVVFPGDKSRMDAAAAAGRSAAPVVAGVVLMLVVAGMLEGFARQLIQIDLARYAIALATLVIWLGYFYTPGRRKVA
ncbi:MAG TPA: stage II sporulation protein M [Caulobacteraceae bacterium]|jgi:uncharacterized membrane protein SpoIIM required for sporulation|nr:stage II sporulation protein M [Caulobacteraceae bacterium]